MYPWAEERLVQAAEASGAVMVYGDYDVWREGRRVAHPTMAYRAGSLRDDFDFGALWVVRGEAFRAAVAQMTADYRYAALYDLRLRLSRMGELFHLPECLYAVEETDGRASGEKQFDYVNPRNREVQVEMDERVAGESYLNLSRSVMYMLRMLLSILFIQNFRKRREVRAK